MIWPAFLIGLLGSAHCIGMCGPIALALPIPADKNRYVGIALYNSGRIITYTFLGFLFGSFGSLFLMAGLQQFLSILAGLTILVIVIVSLMKKSGSFYFSGFNRIVTPLKNAVRSYLKNYSLFSLFMIGILNGFLPCGLIYMAIIGAVATGDALSGATYMMLFGMGTSPAMFMISVVGNILSAKMRSGLTRSIPYVVGIIGVVLIVRGMNLGIPYLSPVISSEKIETSHCCSK